MKRRETAHGSCQARSLLVQFFAPTALILILCVGAIAVVTHLRTQQAFGSYVTAQRAQGLTTRARVLAVTIRLLYTQDGNWTSAQQFLEDQAANVHARLEVEAGSGTVVADSGHTDLGHAYVASANAIVVPIRGRAVPRKLGELALIPEAGSSQPQQVFLDNVDSGLLLIGLGALSAALALAFFSVRRVTVPLSAMTGAAARSCRRRPDATRAGTRYGRSGSSAGGGLQPNGGQPGGDPAHAAGPDRRYRA